MKSITSYREYLQEQLSEADWQIVQSRSLHLGMSAEDWSAFVNPEKRMCKEVPFILKQFSCRGMSKLFRSPQKLTFLDSCGGIGATAEGLLLEQRVQKVFINEVDTETFNSEGQKRDLLSRFSSKCERLTCDWRHLAKMHFITGKDEEGLLVANGLDGITCLGNAFTYLFKREDQIQSLRSFHSLLREEGTLILDERNYHHHFLKPGAQFKCSGNVVYCGVDKVRPYPCYISPSMVIMEYERLHDSVRSHLVLYPFVEGELRSLLEIAGFRDIKTFGDYRERFDPQEPEFLTYVARK